MALIAVIATVYWQQYASPFRDAAGAVIPVLAQALWSFSLRFFIAVLVAEVVFALVLYRRGGWTMPVALVNVALNVLGTVPLLMLLRTGRLCNADFLKQIPPDAHLTGMLTTLVTIAVVGVALIDVCRRVRQGATRGCGQRTRRDGRDPAATWHLACASADLTPPAGAHRQALH